MQKLKFHERKLLKKVNFLKWKRQCNTRKLLILKKYKIHNQEDYNKYNKICGLITKLVTILRTLPSNDNFRVRATEQLNTKLTSLGIKSKKDGITHLENLSASSLCKRRLSSILVASKFCSNVDEAISLIENGHIKIGNQLITNPGIHISTEAEDLLNWANKSSIKKKTHEFQGNIDHLEI